MISFNRNISILGALLCSFVSASALADDDQIETVDAADGLKSSYAQNLKNSPATSEFDHQSSEFVKDWRDSLVAENYEDTQFGELLYNEPSTPTKLEILRLLSKDTPSIKVFLTALSMGNDIENLLQASVDYAPKKNRDLASSAVMLAPYLDVSDQQRYSTYELDDLNRDDNRPYSVAEVINNFFEDGRALRPYPDWFAGQFHFMASAQELSKLVDTGQTSQWYRTKYNRNNSKRPVFISLYRNDKTVLIDDQDRILDSLKIDSNALLPVVFIYNHQKERAIDQLGYPRTIKGVQQAYNDKRLMLTPVPEWQFGEYHLYAELSEFYQLFEIPQEDDFEPQAWQNLLKEAKKYSVNNTSFLFVVLPNSDNDSYQEIENNKTSHRSGGADKSKISAYLSSRTQVSTLALSQENQMYAMWDDPRTESEFPYIASKDNDSLTLKDIMSRGLIFNRPDLIAALNALGVKNVPVAFYYFDESRVKHFKKNPRVLVEAAIGLTNPNGRYGGHGGISARDGGIVEPPPEPPICASPPCTE